MEKKATRWTKAWWGTYHLFSKHANSFDAKLATAHVKEVFEVRSKEIDDENVVEPFLSKVVYLGYSG